MKPYALQKLLQILSGWNKSMCYETNKVMKAYRKQKWERWHISFICWECLPIKANTILKHDFSPSFCSCHNYNWNYMAHKSRMLLFFHTMDNCHTFSRSWFVFPRFFYNGKELWWHVKKGIWMIKLTWGKKDMAPYDIGLC